MSRNIIGLLVCVLLMESYPGFCQQNLFNAGVEDKSRESGYMYAFSEATKMFIFGDFGRAANLYRECLKYEPESGAVHYQLAELYLKAGDIKTAHQYSNLACRYDPENKWYVIQMANIFQSEQMYDSSIVMYETLLNGSGTDIKVFLQIALLLEKKGDYKGSLEYLNKVENKAGISMETAVNKSRVYDHLGMKKESLAELKMALNGKEEDYIVYGIIAEYFRTHKKSDSADFYYRKVIDEHQEDANLMLSYAEFLIEQKRIKEARKLYAGIFENGKIDSNIKYGYVYNAIQDQLFFNRIRQVIDTVAFVMVKENPENIRVMSMYSDVNYRLGNYKASSGILKKIIAKDESNFTAWEQLLFCESAMDKPDSVLYFGEKAISRFENRPLPYLLVSSVYYRNEKFDLAIGLLEKGEPYADTDGLKTEFYSMLAECYSRIMDTEKSDRYYESALLIDSVNVAILNNYAYSLAIRNYQIEKAKSMSKYSIEKEPLNGTYLDTYAWILYMEKDYKGALKFIKKALEYGGGNNPEVLEHYGDILMKMGKDKKALGVYREAIKLGDGEQKKKLNAKVNSLSEKGF
jgi:Tfp pilus assembly protein PilF